MERDDWSREDLVLALIDNLRACRSTAAGPPSRIVPETMCVEIVERLRQALPSHVAQSAPETSRIVH